MASKVITPIRTTAEHLEESLGLEATVVVFETNDCAPCAQLVEHLDALASEFGERLRVVRIVDGAEGWVAARYHLAYVPTISFYCGTSETARIRGNPGAAALRAHALFVLGEAPVPEPAEGPRHTLVGAFKTVRR